MNQTNLYFRQLSPQDFATFGVNDVAYVKALAAAEGPGIGIFAADGTQLAVVSDVNVAMATVRQHDMEPLSVH